MNLCIERSNFREKHKSVERLWSNSFSRIDSESIVRTRGRFVCAPKSCDSRYSTDEFGFADGRVEISNHRALGSCNFLFYNSKVPDAATASESATRRAAAATRLA